MSESTIIGSRQRPASRLALVALLSAVAAFSALQSMVLPALPMMRSDLHASLTASSWVLSAFLLVSSIAAITLGRLGDMFGRKRLLLISVAALLIGSVIAATAASIGVLIAARALQGVGAAAFPLAYGLVRETFPPQRVPAVIGMISSTFGIGFAVGLILPAPLLAVAGWPVVFWLSAVVDALAFVLIAVSLRDSSDRAPGRVDWRGAVMLAFALTCLLLALSQARTWGPQVVGLLGTLAVVALVLFVWWELRTPEPLLQPRLLGHPAVAAADGAGLLVGFGLYGAFSIIPQLAQTPTTHGYGFGASSLQAGLLLLPTAVVMVLISPAAGRLGDRIGHARTLMVAGVIGAFGYAIIAIDLTSIWMLLVCTTILGIAVGLALTAMVNLVLEAVKATDTGQATGLNTISRTIGGALGAQVTAAFIAGSAASSTPVEGYRLAFIACGVGLALVALLAVFADRLGRRR
jgi:MFS family permease